MNAAHTPTPRTDAELLIDTHPRTVAGGWPSGRKATFGHSHIVTADFARQLERELAEAREENTALQKQVDGAKNCLTAIQEAKDLCAKWEEEHAACLKAANDSMDLAEQAIKQRDALARIGGKLRNVCPSSCDDYVAEWDKALATLEGRAE